MLYLSHLSLSLLSSPLSLSPSDRSYKPGPTGVREGGARDTKGGGERRGSEASKQPKKSLWAD